MLTVISVLTVGLAIILIEYPLLKIQKLKKEMYLFIFILFIGIGLSIINYLHIKFPYLLDWLIIVYKPISDIVFRWFT